MATLGELNIKIAANVAQLSQDVTKVEREMRKMRNAGVKASKKMDSAAKGISGFKKLAIGVAAVTIAWRTLSRVVGSSMQAFATQEDAEKTLATALGETNQALLDQASALQKVSVFGDEAIISAQALIGSFVKDEAQIKKATVATLDLAQAKGMDLKAAADLMSKTLGSSTNAMSRYGIEVKGAVGSTERLESLTGNIARVFGGQAAAAAETMGGRIKQMNNAFGDLQEKIMGTVAPSITAFAQKMTTLFENMQKWGKLLSNIWTAVADDARVGLEVIDRQIEKSAAVSSFVDSWKKGFAIIVDNWKVGAGVIVQGMDDVAARGAAISEATKGRGGDDAKKERAQTNAEIVQERLDRNGALIAADQILWEEQLIIETNIANAAKTRHDEQMQRDDETIRMEKAKRDAALSTASGVLNSLSTIAQAGGASFKTQKAIAIAAGTIDSYRAALSAFASTPYPYNFVVAGITFAAGMARVSGIKSQSIGGGGGGGGSFGSAPAAPPEPNVNLDSLLDRQGGAGSGGQTTIVFQGGTFIGSDKDAVARDLTPALLQALEDGQRT